MAFIKTISLDNRNYSDTTVIITQNENIELNPLGGIVTINGNLITSNSATFNSDVTIVGPLAVQDSATFNSDVTIVGPLAVQDSATFNSDVIIAGDLRSPIGGNPLIINDNLDVSGNVQIYGNLQIQGTETTINSQTVTINDKNIVLADSAVDYFSANGAGLTIGGSFYDSANLVKPHIIYASLPDAWEVNKQLNILNDTTINAMGITSNALTIENTSVDSTGITSNVLTIENTSVDSTGIDTNSLDVTGGITAGSVLVGNVLIDSVGLTLTGNAGIDLGDNIQLDDTGLTIETVKAGDAGHTRVDDTGFTIQDSDGDTIVLLTQTGLYLYDSAGIETNSITELGYSGNYIQFDSDWDSSLSAAIDLYQDIKFNSTDRKLELNLMRIGRYAHTANDLGIAEANYANDFNTDYDPGATLFEQYDSLNRIIYFTEIDNHPGIAYYKNAANDPDPYLIDNTYNSEYFGGDSEYQAGRFYHNPVLRKTWYIDRYLPQPQLISEHHRHTDDLREGNLNYYWTDERFDSAFRQNLPAFQYEISANIIIQGFNFDSEEGLQLAFTSDSIAEGPNNLYYTDARVNNYLSVVQEDSSAAGYPGGKLTYSNGIFTFSPSADIDAFLTAADIADFITTETDPIFSAHAAANITSGDIDNLATLSEFSDLTFVQQLATADGTSWDTAFGWGDHASAGYLTSASIDNLHTDELADSWLSSALVANIISATNADVTNWNTAYGWGDHSTAGYLSAVSINTEIDSWMTDNIAPTIISATDDDVTNWNTAYSQSQADYIREGEFQSHFDSAFNADFQPVFDAAFKSAIDSDFPVLFDSGFNASFAAAFNTAFDSGFDSAFNSALELVTTDDLAEGSVNRYLTQTGFNAYFNLKTTDNLAETDDNFYYKSIRFDSDFNTKSTNDLNEGSRARLYYNRSRFDSDFLDAFSGSLNSALDLKTTDDLAEGSVNRYLTQTGFNAYFNLKTTDNLAETDDNFYYKKSRFDSDFNTKSTNDLNEGSSARLYYNRSRFDSDFLDAFSGSLVLSLGDIFEQDSPNAPRRLDLTIAARNALDSASLSDIGDVNDALTPSDGQVLTWNNAEQYWTNSTLPAGYGDNNVAALLNGNLTSNIIPSVDKGISLGDSSHRFNAIHAADLFINSQTINFTSGEGTERTTVATLSYNAAAGNFGFADINGGALSLDSSSISNTIARVSYVDTQIANLINGAGPAFDTLNELAVALESGDADLLSAINAIQGFSGNYNDLSNLPTLFDGAYSSLSGLPTLFDGAYSSLSGLPNILDSADITNVIDATYIQANQTAQDFAYASLTGSPTNVSNFTNDAGYITSVGIISYNNLTDLPTLFDGAYSSLTGTPNVLDSADITNVVDATYIQTNQTAQDFAYSSLTDAPTNVSDFTNDAGYITSVGIISYNDLTDLPTIPSDLTDLGISDGTNGQILTTDGSGNFTFTDAPLGFSGNYNDLSNLPTIPDEPAINRNSGTPTLATGVTASEIRSLIGAGTSNITLGANTWTGLQTFNAGATIPTNQTLNLGNVELLSASNLVMDVNSGDFFIRDGNNANTVRFAFDISSGHFQADGNITAYQATFVSDQRLKQNIINIEAPLEKIKHLNGVNFEWISSGIKSAGVIAQDVETVLPEAVFENINKNTGAEYKTVNYDALHSIYIEAIKELTQKVEALEIQLQNKN